SQDLGQAAIHWDIARMLLDDVRPTGAKKPAPSSDDVVRIWYRSTASWMQNGQHPSKVHHERAHERFRRVPDIPSLLACVHETLADDQIQSVLRSVVLPTNVVLDTNDERAELKAAEELLRDAVAERPDFPEAHLRLGRVVALRGRYADAIPELH